MPSMPPWALLLLLVIAGVLAVGLQAAAVTGSWRTFWVACKQYGGGVLAFAAAGLIVVLFVRMLVP